MSGLVLLGSLPALASVKPPARPKTPARRAPAAEWGAQLSSAARGPARAAEWEKVSLEFKDIAGAEDAATLTSALLGLPGVKSAVVDPKIRLGVVDYDPAVTRLAEFIRVCKSVGIEAAEYRVESRFPKPVKLKGG